MQLRFLRNFQYWKFLVQKIYAPEILKKKISVPFFYCKFAVQLKLLRKLQNPLLVHLHMCTSNSQAKFWCKFLLQISMHLKFLRKLQIRIPVQDLWNLNSPRRVTAIWITHVQPMVPQCMIQNYTSIFIVIFNATMGCKAWHYLCSLFFQICFQLGAELSCLLQVMNRHFKFSIFFLALQ